MLRISVVSSYREDDILSFEFTDPIVRVGSQWRIDVLARVRRHFRVTASYAPRYNTQETTTRSPCSIMSMCIRFTQIRLNILRNYADDQTAYLFRWQLALYIADGTVTWLGCFRASRYYSLYLPFQDLSRQTPGLPYRNFEAQRIPGSIDDVGLPRGSWMFRVPMTRFRINGNELCH